MKFIKFLKRSAVVATCALALTACGGSDKAENKIVVGVMAGPEQVVAETAGKVAKEKYGLTVEYKIFNDYALPNLALGNKELDANAFQHKPYLEKDAESKGLKNLVIAGNTFVYPLAGYSKTIKSVDELKEGATIIIPNDPSNQARALILLEKQGLIKLKDSSNLFSTPTDIVENTKKLVIKPVEASISARALDDADIAVVNNTFATANNLTLKDNGVFVEDKDSPYVNIIVAREDNLQSEPIQNFVKAFQTDEVLNEAKAQFKDGVAKGW